MLKDDIKLAIAWTSFILQAMEREDLKLESLEEATTFGNLMVQVSKNLEWSPAIATPGDTETRVWYRAYSVMLDRHEEVTEDAFDGPHGQFMRLNLMDKFMAPAYELVKAGMNGGSFNNFNKVFALLLEDFKAADPSRTF